MLPIGGDVGLVSALRPFQESPGVDVPIFPVVVALVGLLALLFVGLGAVRLPRLRPRTRPPKARRVAPKRAAHPSPAAPAPDSPGPSTPLYKKAPLAIEFPSIKADFPDVWGLGDPLDVVLRMTDPAHKGKKSIPGLTFHVAGEQVPVVFLNGLTSIRRRFGQRGEHELVAEYQTPEEPQPRRTTRRLRVVDYREEIAEVFHNFKQEASRAITPLREDATAWEIYDTVTEAKADLPRQAVRDIVASFEEAKFSNHAVTRATYERMITALLQLERVEL